MSVKTAVEIGKVLQPIQVGLAQVETKMKNIESSLFAPLAHAFVDLIGSGGKRLRPTLALLAAQIREEQSDSPVFSHIVALAASVEMLHTATLVHDDVIDGALLRRGMPTLNALWNRGATILAGNFMFARAAYFAAETQNPRVIRIFANTLETIVNGELYQLSARHDFHQDKEGYYQRIYAKTASLFAAATEAAAILAGLVEVEVQALRAYGHNLGMAFQIVDDILDFTGSDRQRSARWNCHLTLFLLSAKSSRGRTAHRSYARRLRNGRGWQLAAVGHADQPSRTRASHQPCGRGGPPRSRIFSGSSAWQLGGVAG
jgi:geranylgeranyl pyrophosphate synthase